MTIFHLIKEISAVMDIPTCNKIIKCTTFEDSDGVIELAKAPKMRPRTKYTAIKHHHFTSHVQKGEIIIEKVDAAEQEADFLTKLLVLQLFGYLRKKVIGW